MAGCEILVFNLSETRAQTFLPTFTILTLSLLAKTIFTVTPDCLSLVFKETKSYHVYFCGTKDCHVLIDKYFCQTVVGKDTIAPLVLQPLKNAFLLTFLFNLFFLLELQLNWLIIVLYKTMMCYWIFIINLYGTVHFYCWQVCFFVLFFLPVILGSG